MRAAFAATICYRPHDYVILNMILNFHYQFITALVNPLLKLAHWQMNGWTDMEYDSTSISFEIHWCMLKVSLIKDYSYNKIWFSRLLNSLCFIKIFSSGHSIYQRKNTHFGMNGICNIHARIWIIALRSQNAFISYGSVI